MHNNLLLSFLPLLLLSSATPPPPSSPSAPTYNATACANSTWTEPKRTIAEVMADWGAIWKGNFSVAERVVTDDVALWQDRVPLLPPSSSSSQRGGKEEPEKKNPHLATIFNVTTREDLLDFMRVSHAGFSEYSFVNQFYFVDAEQGDKLVTRWTLEAVVGEETMSPIRNPGDKVTMNGTDILLFDHCSGRIQQVLTAQDILSFSTQMGIDVDLRDSERFKETISH